MSSKLIVGLGNPGTKYQLTRHNIGFLFIDALVEAFAGERKYKSEFKAETQKLKIGDHSVIVCKPQTFMNLSGDSVQPLLQYYNLTPEDLLVVHDEVDLPFGQLRFQTARGHGGHNGIRHIHQMLASDAYARLRLGVGRPPEGSSMEVHQWVLSNFSADERARMTELLELALDGVEVWVARGVAQASSEFNGRELNLLKGT